MSLFDLSIGLAEPAAEAAAGHNMDCARIENRRRTADRQSIFKDRGGPLNPLPASVRLIHSLLVNEIEAKRRVLVSLILLTAIRSISQQPFRPQLENRSSFTLAYGLAVPERAD